MNYILAPSILSADFSELGRDVKKCAVAGAGYIHIDVMDGHFVPNITFGPGLVRDIRKCTDRTFDVHLMVEEPARYTEAFAGAGADIITVHYEACRHLDRTLQLIHGFGKKAGVALNPATPVNVLEDIIPACDMVLLMSVNPGFGGQRYIPYVTEKLRKLRELCVRLGLPEMDIEVDGGVTAENAGLILEAGANVLVAGSAVFKGDIAENIRKFETILEAEAADN